MDKFCDHIGRTSSGASTPGVLLRRWSKLAVAVMTAVFLLQTGAYAHCIAKLGYSRQ